MRSRLPSPPLFAVANSPAQFYEFGSFRSIGATIEVWACNSTLQARQVKLMLHCVDLDSSWSHQQSATVTLHPNQSTELLNIPCPCPPSSHPGPGITTSYSVVVSARLVDQHSGEVLARYADWPQPFKYVEPPNSEPRLRFERTGERVSIHADKPVKGLFLTGDDEPGNLVRWSDNALDLMPGDEQIIEAKGLQEKRRIRYTYFGSEKVQEVQLLDVA